MFWLIWNVIWTVAMAVLFGATLTGIESGGAKTIVLLYFGFSILLGMVGIFINSGFAPGVP